MDATESRPDDALNGGPASILARIAGVPEGGSPPDLYRETVQATVDAGFEGAAFVTVLGRTAETVSVDVPPPAAKAFEHPPEVGEIVLDNREFLGVPVQTVDERFGTLLVRLDGAVTDELIDRFAVIGTALGSRLGSLSPRTTETEVTSRRRIFRKLHSVATQMVGTHSEEGVFHLAIDAAENILDFDSCSIDVVDDGYFRPVATSTRIPETVSRELPVDEGIAGETFEANRSIVVDDVADYESARPVDPSFKSILSVPIEDVGVFQAATEKPNAFDQSDADLAELLMSYVSQTITRIRSEESVRENEERYRTLVEQSHDAVLTIRDEAVEFVNHRAAELFGYDRNELESMSVWDLVYPEDRERLRRSGKDLRHGLRDSMTFDARILRADGDVRFCEFSVTRIENQDDLVAMATARDVTERRAYERQLERQNERLDEFASVVSHDLRNPLNVAEGRIRLANKTGTLSHLDDALDALDRMDDVIDDVLTWARQGKTVEHPSEVDVVSVAERAWKTVDTRDASLSLPATDELAIPADERRLRRLLENLFRNAVEHGGDDVTVSVGPIENGFYVEDDGVGIPASDREDVFDRGFTKTESGTGFGLTIVRDIVDVHDWSIEIVESDTGARFEIRETTHPDLSEC